MLDSLREPMKQNTTGGSLLLLRDRKNVSISILFEKVLNKGGRILGNQEYMLNDSTKWQVM